MIQPINSSRHERHHQQEQQRESTSNQGGGFPRRQRHPQHTKQQQVEGQRRLLHPQLTQQQLTVRLEEPRGTHSRRREVHSSKGQSRRGPWHTWERSVQQRERSAVSLAQQPHQQKFPTSKRIQEGRTKRDWGSRSKLKQMKYDEWVLEWGRVGSFYSFTRGLGLN